MDRTKLPPTTQAAIDVLTRVQDILVVKSSYYGDSIGNAMLSLSNATPEMKLIVRIEDKLSRIARGTGDNTDAWIDLIGYAALLLAVRTPVVPTPDDAIPDDLGHIGDHGEESVQYLRCCEGELPCTAWALCPQFGRSKSK